MARALLLVTSLMRLTPSAVVDDRPAPASPWSPELRQPAERAAIAPALDCSQSSQPTIPPGEVIAGRFRVEYLIGLGGMGQVYRARHLQLEATVAIKVIRPELRSDHRIVERFLDEGRVAAAISSRHVARVLDAGHLHDRSPFLVLELVDGPDLAAVIARARTAGATLPPALCVAYAIDVCEGLAAAHRQGIVHRDIKPSNLLLATSPSGSTCVKVVDFGVAKRVVPRPQHLATNPRFAIGSPHHMSPEQLLGRNVDASQASVDARTDVWSFGVVLYELLTGELPFAGGDMLEVGTRILESEPIDPARKNPHVPSELGDLVLRCLRKRRDERPADTGLLAFELRQIRARLDASGASHVGTPAGTELASGRARSRAQPTRRAPRDHANGELDRTVPCSSGQMRHRAPVVASPWGPPTPSAPSSSLLSWVNAPTAPRLVAAFAIAVAAFAAALIVFR